MNKDTDTSQNKPLILAPAGSRASFLAALVAGADAVYCGSKLFSARMEADNFSLNDLARLTRLAHSRNVKVHITLNTLVKPDELDKAGRLVDRLNRWVRPDALIVQDPAFAVLARQVGFKGELHLSTLANVTFPAALAWARKTMGADQVVLPRELSVDEMKAMVRACPDGMHLETFIHGALCYGVSGRCYWSSFLGGRSGLRGRCVQPCRRLYEQQGHRQRFFSCRDLSLDVLTKVLRPMTRLRTWKIEGRKKGPHYVYYTVQAYRMLRDEGHDPKIKKAALAYLEQALGRPATHYRFLSQRLQNPVDSRVQTGSGLFVGRIQGGKQQSFLVPRVGLLPGDLLRLGYEDDPGHRIQKVSKSIPKRGRLYLTSSAKGKTSRKLPEKGAPVFLIDRRERFLQEQLKKLEAEFAAIPLVQTEKSGFKTSVSCRTIRKQAPAEMHVHRMPAADSKGTPTGIWMSARSVRAVPKGVFQRCWWWLPPVVWPDEEKQIRLLIDRIVSTGGRNFMLNAPWQMAWFKKGRDLNLWAGPFCNVANGLAIDWLRAAGFKGVIVSPELSGQDYVELAGQSSLPLGIVITGNWPLVIARTLTDDLRTGQLFSSPRGEQAWAARQGSNYWIYPNWKLDLISKKTMLTKAGYTLLVHLHEPLPRKLELKKRPGLWNWDLRLL